MTVGVLCLVLSLLAVLDVISGFVVFLVYCDSGCSVFGPYLVELCLIVFLVL